MSLDKIFEQFQKLKNLITVHAPEALDRISEILGTAKDAVDDAAAWLRGGKLLAKKVETAKTKKDKKSIEEKTEERSEELEVGIQRLSKLRQEFRMMGMKANATVMAERKKQKSAIAPGLEIALTKTVAGILDAVISEAEKVRDQKNNQENEPS